MRGGRKKKKKHHLHTKCLQQLNPHVTRLPKRLRSKRDDTPLKIKLLDYLTGGGGGGVGLLVLEWKQITVVLPPPPITNTSLL